MVKKKKNRQLLVLEVEGDVNYARFWRYELIGVQIAWQIGSRFDRNCAIEDIKKNFFFF